MFPRVAGISRDSRQRYMDIGQVHLEDVQSSGLSLFRPWYLVRSMCMERARLHVNSTPVTYNKQSNTPDISRPLRLSIPSKLLYDYQRFPTRFDRSGYSRSPMTFVPVKSQQSSNTNSLSFCLFLTKLAYISPRPKYSALE